MAKRKPKKQKPKLTQTEELNKILLKRLMLLISILIFLVGAFAFFAPQLGSFFGIFSKYRNEEDETIIKPNPPIFSSIPNSTKNVKITINGYSQPGITIKLFVNGPEKAETVVGADGLFSFGNISLNSGRNTIFSKAVDAYGNESDKSSTYQIYVDKDVPEIEIESPKKGETVKNLDKRIKVRGSVNEKATIIINNRLAVQRPDFSFEILLGVQEGSVKIEIEATDEAGNQSKETIYVTYQRSSD